MSDRGVVLRLPPLDDLVDRRHDGVQRRGRRQHRRHAALLEQRHVAMGNGAAHDNRDVLCSRRTQSRRHLSCKGDVRAGKHRQADDVGVLFYRHLHSPSGALRKPR